MIEDSRLKIFRAVVEEESFTLAAARLGISQPAVSQNIAELEKAVGRKLFLRNRYTVRLNEDGVAFNEYASQIEYWYGVLNSAFRSGIPALPGKKRTRLTIGIDESFDPHFVPAGSPEADIDIAMQGGNLRITTLCRQRSLKLPAAAASNVEIEAPNGASATQGAWGMRPPVNKRDAARSTDASNVETKKAEPSKDSTHSLF
jgi:hypothetical protein